VLIGLPVLIRIRDGEIDRVYRRWAAPRVKRGSRMRTAVGVLEVRSVEMVDAADVGTDEAVAAGFADRNTLLAWLDGREGEIHCIQLAYVGPDPRVELREQIPDGAEIEHIRARLAGMDARSHQPWTREVLAVIAHNPEVRAEDLAGMLGRGKKPFKLDVRKLKELGLTESLRVGYRLSPRGEAVLRAIDSEG
jgi:hypothetical protein